MKIKQTMNYYLATETKYGTAMYSGFAESEERFKELCDEAGFDLEDLEIVLDSINPKDEMGRLYKEGVRKDLGTI